MPLRSAETELRNTIDLQHTTVEHIALMQQFQCTKCRNTCKKKRTASTKKRKSHLEPSVPQRAQIEYASTAKQGSPHPSRNRAYFSPQRNIRLPKKTQMFCASLNAQIASMMCQFQCDPASSDLQNTIRLARQYCRRITFREALTQPLYCDLHRLSC